LCGESHCVVRVRFENNFVIWDHTKTIFRFNADFYYYSLIIRAKTKQA
jgi:hypothetical protein